jgi:hypothetical protein
MSSPPIETVCGLASDCSAAIIVSNDPKLGGSGAGRRVADSGDVPATYLGSTLSCPPFCPGLLATGKVFPLPVNSNGTKGSFVPAVSYGVGLSSVNRFHVIVRVSW